jgi:hypothetical protein
MTKEQAISEIQTNTNFTSRQRNNAIEGLSLNFLNPTQATDERFIRDVIDPRLEVGYHESGHGVLVPAVGAERIIISVIPNGNTLGSTRFHLTTSGEQALWDHLIIACGSRAGEEVHDNHDHSGCGGDNSVINAISNILRTRFHRTPSEIAAASSRARSDVFRSSQDVTFMAWRLALNGTI